MADHFDIKQMLHILKVEDWENIRPFKHILTPLNDAVINTRKNLLKKHADGHLFMKYIIENNENLKKAVVDMVKKDVKA